MGSCNGVTTTQSLFDPSLIKKLNWSKCRCNFKAAVSPTSPGPGLLLRPLERGDINKGHLDLLAQLTSIGTVELEEYEERFDKMLNCHNTYYIIVLEDMNHKRIVGSASLVLEQKFIHSAGQRGRIEDVIVSDTQRGKELGKLLVQTLTLLGEALGCYKLSLECLDDKVKFYQGFGFNTDKNTYMVQRFKP